MDVSVVVWAATIAGLVVIFGLDILLMGRRPPAVGMREAAFSVVGYVALAALFGVGRGLVMSPPASAFVWNLRRPATSM